MSTDAIFNTILDERMRSTVKSSRPYSHVKSGDGTSLMMVIPGTPRIDEARMYARFLISTPTEDRVGDVLLSTGCSLKNYRKNPCVYYGHGLEGLTLPIGSSEGPNGNLDIEINNDEVWAGCYYSQKSLEAAQVFDLVVEKIIRAASVRETPLKYREGRNENGERIVIVDEWDLEEWSNCGVPVNPDAATKDRLSTLLHRNRLAGKPILESISKSLNAIATPLKRPGVGFKEKTVADKDDDTLDETGSEKRSPENTPYDQADDAGSGAGNDSPAAETEPGGDPGKVPYGRQVIAAAHDSLKCLCKDIDSAMGEKGKLVEHPEVRTGLQACRDGCDDQKTALEGLHAEHYPDEKPLDSMKDEDGGDDSGGDDEGDDEGGDSDSAMKSFLFRRLDGRTRVKGAIVLLSQIASNKSLSPAIKAQLKSIYGTLNRVHIEADAAARAAVKSQRADAAKKAREESQAKSTAAAAEAVKPKVDTEAAEKLRKLIGS